MRRLTRADQGALLAKWFLIMERCCQLVEPYLNNDNYRLETMVVKKGNDSSTWNALAGAFNKARDGWLNTLYALGMERLLDDFLPGKWLRLMAADVVFMHSRYGDKDEVLDPDTKIWRDLPKPWEVVLGGMRCDRSMIEQRCFDYKIEGRGWLAPRKKEVEEFTPTPDLVHGVVVTSPVLAKILKRANFFAGPSKGKVKPDAVPGFVKTYDPQSKLTIASFVEDLIGNDRNEEED